MNISKSHVYRYFEQNNGETAMFNSFFNTREFEFHPSNIFFFFLLFFPSPSCSCSVLLRVVYNSNSVFLITIQTILVDWPASVLVPFLD